MMMCGKKEEEQEEDWSQSIHNIETIQHQLLLQQNPTDSYQWSLPQVQYLSPCPVRDHNPYGSSFFNRRAYEGPPASDQLRVLSETLMGQAVRPGLDSGSFGVRAEMGQIRAQEIIDAKAIAASKSHSEAERRRRERINNHLAKLRSLLPSTTKTDKASLLAEVIQHVKDLKRQTTLIAKSSPVPTELDELTVNEASDDDGKLIIKASLCCEDRSDLLPDLIKALKALSLKTLRAEITTLGGRVRNVLFVTGDEDQQQQQQQENSMSLVQEALKAVMGRASGNESSSSGSVKRQRTNMNVVEHRSF